MTNYEWYKAHGICPRCGSERASRGHTLCLNCLDSQSVSTGQYRAKMTEERKAEEREKNRLRCRDRYQRAKEKGICLRCFKNEPRPGRAICQSCFNKISIGQKVYQQERRDREKRSKGNNQRDV